MEINTGLSGLSIVSVISSSIFSGLFAIVITYSLTRRKTNAEIEYLKAKTRILEADLQTSEKDKHDDTDSTEGSILGLAEIKVYCEVPIWIGLNPNCRAEILLESSQRARHRLIVPFGKFETLQIEPGIQYELSVGLTYIPALLKNNFGSYLVTKTIQLSRDKEALLSYKPPEFPWLDPKFTYHEFSKDEPKSDSID